MVYLCTRIEQEVLCPSNEQARMLQALESTSGGLGGIGAICSFIGTVRAAPATVSSGVFVALHLQHYPGMSERCLHELGQNTVARFDLLALTLIHRVGRLLPTEAIVLVLAAAAHRKAAIHAVDYAMDHLKSTIPLWKREEWERQALWVQAQDLDQQRLQAWQ